ncbi:MAG: transposase family protein [Prevotella sp.]|nr:transposase family protein [Prevotella sp.]
MPCIEERLAFILSYLKLNPIQEAQADLFGIEQKQRYELVHALETILRRALELCDRVPTTGDRKLQEVLSECPTQRMQKYAKNAKEMLCALCDTFCVLCVLCVK